MVIKPRISCSVSKERGIELDAAIETFDKVYAGERPGFLQGYAALKEAIQPWGS